MNLNEYKTILSDIGGIQLLESFIKKDTFNTDVPEYLDTMFAEQSEDNTLVYLNDCKFKYKKLSEEDFNKLIDLINENQLGSAVMFINSRSKLECSLKEANIIASKMIRFINDNLHIVESDGKKTLKEDWNRDFSRRIYKKSIIKSAKLNEEGNLLVAIRDGSKSYLVEYRTNSRLANKVVGSFEYLGESYSRMILSDLVNVSSSYHVTTRFDEADTLGPGVYAITNIEVVGDDQIELTFVDKDSAKEYKNVGTVDLNIVKEDGIDSLKDFIEPYKDQIEDMKFEDDIEYAVQKSADILSDLSAYFKGGLSYATRVSTGNKDYTYSNTSSIEGKVREDGKVVKGEDGKPLTRQYAPLDIDFNIKAGAKEEDLQSGKYVKIDDNVVENYCLKLLLADRDGNQWVRAYRMKPSLREVLSLEEWYDEVIEELPEVNPETMTFDEALEKMKPFVKKLAQDAISDDIKHGDNTGKITWKVQEDAGCLQTEDVPEKVDYNEDKLQKAVISESSELILEAWLVDLISRGFEPDSEGYLTRGGKYLVREKDNLIIKHHSELWEQDGTPIDDSLDIVSIID